MRPHNRFHQRLIDGIGCKCYPPCFEHTHPYSDVDIVIFSEKCDDGSNARSIDVDSGQLNGFLCVYVRVCFLCNRILADRPFLLVLVFMPHSWVFSLCNSIFFRFLVWFLLIVSTFLSHAHPKIRSSQILNEVEFGILLLEAFISLATHLPYDIINEPLITFCYPIILRQN